MQFNLPKKKTCGQIYLDLLIAIAILAILSAALFSLVATALSLTSFTKARITAKHLAQEKIELIRNLSYQNVGTIGGIPSGPLPQDENIFRNDLNYHVKTTIVYIDDPFDESAPDDLLPTDYKRVRVEVFWEGLAASAKNPITLITDIAPRGIETTKGGGTLSILIFDANSQPVPQAAVSITNDKVDPVINLNLKSDDNGRVILPGAPVCTDCYKVSVSKENYSSERTYSPEEIANPYKPHLSVLENQLTEISFMIDKLSILNVASVEDRENNFVPLPNQGFGLQGEKILGTDVNDEPVYKFDKTFTTDGTGKLVIEELEWDNYHFTLEESGWDIAGTNPMLPIVLLPGKTLDFKFALSVHRENSLLTIFKNEAQNPIASVSAKLSDESGFEASIASGLIDDPDFGQVFFGNLNVQEYLLEATASGFLDFQDYINVSGTTQEEIILEAE